MPEAAARAFDCLHYRACLDPAAAADTSFPCPCERYRRDPGAVRWSDVAACQVLVLAVLRPDAFDVFTQLRTLDDNRGKWAVLRQAWPGLGLRRRDMIRAERW